MNKYKKLKIYRFAKDLKSFKKSKQLRCLIFGNFGAMNLGDESILWGEISEIKSNVSNVDICVVSRYPSKVNKIHSESHIRTVYVKDIIQIIVEIFRSDIVIIGGGGLFCKPSGKITGLLYQQYFMWLFMFIPKVLNKSVYALGIGIYKNMNKLNLITAINILKIIDKVTVRDFHSFDLLKSYKVKAKIYKDNSYLMQIDNGKISPKRKNKIKKSNVGLSLRRPNDPVLANKLLKQLVIYMKSNPRHKYFLFSLDSHPNKKNDILYNRELINLAKKSSVNIERIDRKDNPIEGFSDFKKMDYMICMRLHSMIFSDRLAIPFCGIAYDLKCESFLNSIGKENLIVDDDLSKVLSNRIKI